MRNFYVLKLMKSFLRPLPLLAAMLFWTVTASAQSINLSMNDATIREVIEKLQKDYGYSFSIKTSEVDVTKRISVSVRNADIRSVLDKVFEGLNVAYTIEGSIISVTEAAPTSAPKPDTGKPAVIRGTVVDDGGAPVAGATVILMGTTQGTSTGVDGTFQLSTTQRNPVLQVSFLGMKSVQYPVASTASAVRVTLEADDRVIDDVVVIGYGTQRRSMMTNAVAQFKPDENNVRSALSPSELLQGRVAGVSASSASGNLGTADRISIRGASSLNASNQPLYVVDGTPLNNMSGSLYSFGEDLSALAVLNLTDIESIEILKDAASAAIYGSRATNGVILITTKQGKEGKSDVRINYNFGVSKFPGKNRIDYADSGSWVRIYNEGIDNYNRQNGYVRTDAGYIAHIRNPFDDLPDTDWLDLITRPGLLQNVDVAFSGGTQKTKYYMGAGYEYQEGVIKHNDVNKINLKSNVSTQITKWLNVGANMSGNYLKNNRVPGAALGSSVIARTVEQRPFDRPYKPNGDYYLGGTDELSRHNPTQLVGEETSYVDNYRFLGSFFAEASITKKLKVKAAFNTDAAYTLDYLYYNANHPYKEDNGRVIEKTRLMNTNLLDVYANYDDQWGDWSFGAMAGHSFQKTYTRANSIDAQNFASPAFSMVGSAAVPSGVTGGISEYAMESWFGRVNLAFKERYILNATFRADGSSKFAPDTRWGYFPSVSLGWNITKEDFWKSSTTDLKFRVSYGQTGNQDGFNDYIWRPQITSTRANYGGKSGIAVYEMGNPSLTWETADQYDAGFDLSLLKGKINMIFDTYLKNTRNLLYNRPIPTDWWGQKAVMSNIGEMRNYGIEFTINTHFNLGPVNWTSSLNISHNKNKILKLSDDVDEVDLTTHILKVGKEVGAYYLLRFDGIYQYDGEVPNAQYDLGMRAGDMKYYDRDGNGTINSTDRIVTRSPNPDFAGGWNNSFSWKGFNLSIFLTYSYGNYVYAQWMTGPTRMGNYQGLLQEWADNRWTGPGSTNSYPRPIYSYHGNNAQASTYYLKDGSFIKLKSLMLSYTLPKRWTSAISMSNVRVFVQGENLALLSKYPGWDPELSVSTDPRTMGNDNYGVPSPRLFKTGVNITF